MRPASRKLDQLTSLRFFAALMIVVHHSAGLFGTREVGVNFGQGVSFFFVLSGFILTYVYPRLAGAAEARRFLRARVARIWPAHLAALALGALLVGYRFEPVTLLANLAMVQAWIPMSAFYFSYNAVSWSISTEFFFYLAFPLLIVAWNRTWWWKWLLAAGVLCVLFAISNALSLPVYGDPYAGGGRWVTQNGLVYIHPLARLLEFVTGMGIALLWQRTRERAPGVAAGTVLEVVALLACAAAMLHVNKLALLAHPLLGAAGQLWLMHAGSMLAFGLLIYVAALGRGLVSRALSLPAIVLLGEISYSMYLVHQILLRYYRTHRPDFAHLPDPVALGLFLAILLLLSYLMWALVEMPGRRLLVGGGATVHGTGVLARSWQDTLQLHRRSAFAGVALLAVTALAHYGWRAPQAPAAVAAAAPAALPAGPLLHAGTRFGDDATLQGLALRCTGDALELHVAWASANGQAGRLRNAVHVVDDAGNIVTQFDYAQPAPTAAARGGGVWTDHVRMPFARLRDTGAWRIALGVYDKGRGLRIIDRGPRDWGNRRLVMPLPPCARAALRPARAATATATGPDSP